MNENQLKKILDNHKLWLAGAGGERANFHYANFRNADFRYADLSYADLSYANFSHANFSYANFSYANFSYANFSHANFSHADLSYANFHYANISEIKPSWQSHDLLAEILFREASNDIEKRKAAGLILISKDWCWGNFSSLTSEPVFKWVLDTLKKYENEFAPLVIQKHKVEVELCQ